MVKPLILVIDDETGPRESLRMILKPHYEVVLAETPTQGLNLARELRPRMVFCDIKMPEMEGPEVLRRLKEIDPDVQVALITAYAAVDTAQKAVRLGAVDYITKPFAVDDILAVARRAVEQREMLDRQHVLLAQLTPVAETLVGALGSLGTAGEEDLSGDLQQAHTSIEEQLSKIARLSQIGEMASEVAHDVRNFLSAILLRIELLMMRLRAAEAIDAQMVQDDLQHIVQAARDGTDAVQRISSANRIDPYEPSETVDLNQLVRDVVGIAGGSDAAGEHGALLVDLGTPPPVFASPPALRTVLMNLIVNARHALPAEGGEICVVTRAADGQAVIEVRDNGVGMSPEVLARITEPFFTTRGAQGTGLGLSVVQKVVQRHGGALEFTSEVGRGTTAAVTLPSAQATREAAATPPAAEAVSVPDALVVDDDERVLHSIRAVLMSAGLSSEGAPNAGKGLERFEEYLRSAGQGPWVVVTDLRMPGLAGTDLARRVKEMAPGTRVVVVSAYLDNRGAATLPPFVDALLRKPFSATELLMHVGERAEA